MIDQQKRRFRTGDHRVSLILLVLTLDSTRKFVVKVQLQNLRETSLASYTSYLTIGYVLCGFRSWRFSTYSTSSNGRPKNEFITNSCTRLSILRASADFCIIKGMGRLQQGQGQVVACSGIKKDGSLRDISNGIGITERTSVDSTST